jgi:hypothetical protein
MSRRAQRWLFWILLAFVAFQIYVVREWLAAVALIAVVCAGISLVVFSAIVLDAGWQRLRAAVATAWNVSRSAMESVRALIADSNSQ